MKDAHACLAVTMCVKSCSRAALHSLHISQRSGLRSADAPEAVIRRRRRPHLVDGLGPLEVI